MPETTTTASPTLEVAELETQRLSLSDDSPDQINSFCNGYSTGTEFYKLIGQAQEGRDSVNTAADVADNVKSAIESNTPFRVVRMSLARGVDMIVVGKITEK